MIVVDDQTTRDEIMEAIALLCADAKKVSRCGAAAMLAPEYARTHRRIDALCCELEGRG